MVNRLFANFVLFFFNATATTEIYTLSLHDALPICGVGGTAGDDLPQPVRREGVKTCTLVIDRKSTRLNSSHGYISYAVFCLKKKKTKTRYTQSICLMLLIRIVFNFTLY